MVNESRIREKDLVLPVLALIAEIGDPDTGLAISEIDKQLRQRLDLSEADRTILKDRKDDRFSQVVRNLVSHRTLERDGLAIYRRGGEFGRGAYVLTIKGQQLVGKPEKIQLDLFRNSMRDAHE